MAHEPRDFQQDLAESLVAESHPTVRAALKACYPDLLKVHRAHQDNDLLGVDFVLERKCAHLTRCDVKIRKLDYGARRGAPLDVVVEISVGGRPGWAMKETMADSIMFVYMDSGRSIAFDAKGLRMATIANHRAWLQQYPRVGPSTNFGFGRSAVPSVAVAVPADVLQAAINDLQALCEPHGFESKPWWEY